MTTDVTHITLSPLQEPCPSWVLDMLIAWLADREVEVSAAECTAVNDNVEVRELERITA